MGIKFPSQEWADAMKEEIKKSDAYASAAKNWEGDFYFVVEGTNPPDMIYMDLWHGDCREATYTTDPNYKSPEFKISATEDKWQKVLTGKLDPIQGLMTRQLKLDGNLIKIMKNVKAAQELVRCATKVDTDFGE
jgi:putative sterol carrier protein